MRLTFEQTLTITAAVAGVALVAGSVWAGMRHREYLDTHCTVVAQADARTTVGFRPLTGQFGLVTVPASVTYACNK